MDTTLDLDAWRTKIARVTETYDGDPEAAHGDEDDLLAEFVRAVADGLPEAEARQVAAVIAADLLDRPRTRWYA